MLRSGRGGWPPPITGASRWLLTPTGTLRTPWGIQGLAHNRAKLTKIGGVPLFRSICVLFILPRVSNEQVSSKQRGPVSPNINKRPPSRSLFWSWGPFPLLDPCYGQYTMLRNLHGPVSPNIYNRPPFQSLLPTRQSHVPLRALLWSI